LIELREEARKDYDHYQIKLEKLILKDSKNEKDNTKKSRVIFSIIYIKNEEKYLKAKSYYISTTTKAFKKIESLINERYRLINPILMKVKLNITL